MHSANTGSEACGGNVSTEAIAALPEVSTARPAPCASCCHHNRRNTCDVSPDYAECSDRCKCGRPLCAQARVFSVNDEPARCEDCAGDRLAELGCEDWPSTTHCGAATCQPSCERETAPVMTPDECFAALRASLGGA